MRTPEGRRSSGWNFSLLFPLLVIFVSSSILIFIIYVTHVLSSRPWARCPNSPFLYFLSPFDSSSTNMSQLWKVTEAALPLGLVLIGVLGSSAQSSNGAARFIRRYLHNGEIKQKSSPRVSSAILIVTYLVVS